MHAEPLRLQGPKLIHPRVFADERGFFMESYHAPGFEALGLPTLWVQDNHSRSSKGTLRGLHFQAGEGQAKLVRCVRGAIWDVVVDIRPDSPTWGEWEAVELSEENKTMLFIPTGFAHGFVVLSESAEVLYKCSRVYDAALESGIAWDDPQIAVAWPIADPILSQRDRQNISLADLRAKLTS